MTSKMLVRALTAVGLLGLLPIAAAAPGESEWRKPWGLNLPEGVTSLSQQAYDLHMLVFYIVCAIGAFVFIGIFYSIWKFRHSQGAKPANFHHNTTVEVVWTVVPFLILLGIAVPATQTMIKMEDTSGYDMTVKVTGYQWMWEYEYMDEDISFFSRLDRDSQRARQRDPEISPQEVEHYLLDVDNPLVVPIDKKIRFLLTANDVIHSWWVPELGWKKDTIPGFINEAWARIEEPGVYRGQCAELCGRDHGFMPIVVIALEQDEYDDWVAEQNGDVAAAGDDPADVDVDADAGADEVADEQLEDMSQDELMSLGGQVYDSQCLACHRAEGEGMGSFPALAGNDEVTGDVSQVKDVIINGVSGTAMQAFGGRLDDREIAGLVTYIRNAWGNDAGDLVQPSEIRDAR
ncbi:cytochrome c oxidase subunit II [Aquisalimonas sp.]|uniref:cytochrome c oxidase subunit II n=1 Tax=unclassified Aquisalimonas TaxID=2644645 RepID=UPI0025C3F7EB|nr:cytochrome c oxidase subunit II [Aquisalimonas sp.]